MSWICPICYEADEPEWNWVTIQGEEQIRVPTCPHCGNEMEEADTCPLCHEPKRKDRGLCFDCKRTLMKGLKIAVDAVALRSIPEDVKWEAVAEVSQQEADRLWYEARRREKTK